MRKLEQQQQQKQQQEEEEKKTRAVVAALAPPLSCISVSSMFPSLSWAVDAGKWVKWQLDRAVAPPRPRILHSY